VRPNPSLLFEPFYNLNYPGDANLSASPSIEGKEVSRYFKGKNWADLRVDSMRADYAGDPAACLSFMTDDAFRFYFPGYMRMALLEYETADAIFDAVVSKIARASEPGELRRVFEKYDRPQLSAIASLTEVLSENFCRFYPVDIAKESLERYWTKYIQS
jgi:hypothetical protein